MTDNIKKSTWAKLVVITCIVLAAYHILRAKGRACRRKQSAAVRGEEE